MDKAIPAIAPAQPMTNHKLRRRLGALVLDRLNGVSYIFDHSRKRVAYVSPSYEHIWGATRKSLYANPESFLEAINISHRDEVRQCLRAQSAGSNTRAIYQVIRPDGTSSWIDDRAYALTNDGSLYTIGFAKDVTDFKTAEQALHQRTQLLQATLHAARLFVWRYDYKANTGQWSTNLFTFLNLTHMLAEHSGTAASPAQLETALLSRIHPDDLPYVQGNLHVLSSMRFRILQPSGAIKYVELREELTHDANLNRIGSLGILQDITESVNRIQIESNVKRLEALRVFSAGLAHDLNNLLSIILGNLTEARDIDTGQASESISGAIAAAERSVNLLRSLMDLGRIKDKTQITTVEVDEQLSAVVKMAEAIVGSSHDLILECDAKGAKIDCNPLWLDRAVINLITNARDAMPDGGPIRIGSMLIDRETLASIAPRLSAEVAVQISVKDTGIGMTPDQLARAADPYFTTKKTGFGTGLGLTSVTSFTQNCNGQLILRPTEPSGTTAIILLPVVHLPTHQHPQEATNPARPELTTMASTRDPKRILLVDDEVLLLKLLSRTLQRNGFDVTAVSSPAEARKLLQSSAYDTLVTDLTLSELEDGMSLATWASSNFMRMRVILISGYLDAGANLPARVSFLQKPFSNEDLLAELEKQPAAER